MTLASSSQYVIAAAIFLGVHPHIFAHASPLEERQASLPTGWVPFGCFSDKPAARTLKILSFTNVTGMTIESCTAFCAPSEFLFAGVEFSRECYCDNVIGPFATQIAESTCNMTCTGNAGEICGGAGAISIFQNTDAPKIKQLAGIYQYLGCYQDGVNGAPRSLQNKLSVTGGMSAEKCAAACKAAGFVLAGLEFGQECWCDSYFPSPVLVPDTDCNIICTGDNTELCGAGNRLAVYQDTTAPALSLDTLCLTCAQLHTTAFGTASFGRFGIPSFNLTAQPLASAAFPIATPTSLAPFQIGATELPPTSGQPTFQGLTVNTGFDGVHTFSMLCDDGFPQLFVLQTVDPIRFAFTVLPSTGQPLQFSEGNGPSTVAQSFCAQPNGFSKSTYIGPPLIGIDGLTSQWGFCPVGTLPDGNNRLVTFAPQDAAQSFDCIPILLEVNIISS